MPVEARESWAEEAAAKSKHLRELCSECSPWPSASGLRRPIVRNCNLSGRDRREKFRRPLDRKGWLRNTAMNSSALLSIDHGVWLELVYCPRQATYASVAAEKRVRSKCQR